MSKSEAGYSSGKETADRVRVELHELQEESPIERRYRGTDADHHDMIVLGRRQVLRVSATTAAWRSDETDNAGRETLSSYRL